MPTSSGIPDEQLARARLAWISAGQPALSAPRRALSPDEEPGAAADPPTPGTVPRTGVAALLPAPAAAVLEQALRRRYVVAVLVLLLVGLGITMAVLSRSQASQIPVEPPSTVATQDAPPPAPASPTPEPVLLRVHVLGAVVSPGVVSVPDGAIVADALEAAGGLLPEADPAQLNLAARLADGQQVVVGTNETPLGDVRGEPPPGAAGDAAGALVNLNTASQAQLEELPGVGPVLAGEIIAWREANSGFSAVADLQEVSGVGPKTYERLEPLVTV